MKVKDLIQKLQQFDPEVDFLIPGYEGGIRPAEDLQAIEFFKNVHSEWYYGAHEEVTDYSKTQYPNHKKHKGVLLS